MSYFYTNDDIIYVNVSAITILMVWQYFFPILNRKSLMQNLKVILKVFKAKYVHKKGSFVSISEHKLIMN